MVISSELFGHNTEFAWADIYLRQAVDLATLAFRIAHVDRRGTVAGSAKPSPPALLIRAPSPARSQGAETDCQGGSKEADEKEGGKEEDDELEAAAAAAAAVIQPEVIRALRKYLVDPPFD